MFKTLLKRWGRGLLLIAMIVFVFTEIQNSRAFQVTGTDPSSELTSVATINERSADSSLISDQVSTRFMNAPLNDRTISSYTDSPHTSYQKEDDTPAYNAYTDFKETDGDTYKTKDDHDSKKDDHEYKTIDDIDEHDYKKDDDTYKKKDDHDD
ncbi:MAG: hypothetical protein IMX04_05625 [Candidatus Carbobacillus altaicus]|nr:hypothetical protein [Candidatus Carbobacillus altaicus]